MQPRRREDTKKLWYKKAFSSCLRAFVVAFSWTVPVLGGQPTRLLLNASGLTWIADHLVLFSEIMTGLHMGIVTATEGRASRRSVT